jgi:hypothetical protein
MTERATVKHRGFFFALAVAAGLGLGLALVAFGDAWYGGFSGVQFIGAH